MLDRARSKFRLIAEYPFLKSVGHPFSQEVVQISSWPDAAKECSEGKWENCRLMARNRLQRLTERKSWQRAQEWDVAADELRPQIIQLVDTTFLHSAIPSVVVKTIKDEITWDIMHICIEEMFADIVEPLFYVAYLDPVYRSGHFPCGWEGKDFPSGWDGNLMGGKLKVF